MRNIREKGRQRDRDELKQMAEAILFTWPMIANKRVQRSAGSSCTGKLSIRQW